MSQPIPAEPSSSLRLIEGTPSPSNRKPYLLGVTSGVIASLIAAAILAVVDAIGSLSFSDFVTYVFTPLWIVAFLVTSTALALGTTRRDEKVADLLEQHSELLLAHAEAIEALQQAVGGDLVKRADGKQVHNARAQPEE